MKKEFTKEEVIKGSGCYLKEGKTESYISLLSTPINIETILNLPVGIKDKRWFIYNSCELTVANKKLLALKLAWAVLPIYEEEYPNDSRVRDCLQDTEDSYKGSITKKVLLQKKSAYAYTADAYATYAAAYAAAATYAVAAVDADAAAVDAVDAVDAATFAAAAADAADAVDRNKVLSYSEKLNNIFIEFFK